MTLDIQENRLKMFGTLLEITGPGRLKIDKDKFPLRFLKTGEDGNKRWAVLVYAGMEKEFIDAIEAQNLWMLDEEWASHYKGNLHEFDEE